jgi:hypothetical protein
MSVRPVKINQPRTNPVTVFRSRAVVEDLDDVAEFVAVTTGLSPHRTQQNPHLQHQ